MNSLLAVLSLYIIDIHAGILGLPEALLESKILVLDQALELQKKAYDYFLSSKCSVGLYELCDMSFRKYVQDLALDKVDWPLRI